MKKYNRRQYFTVTIALLVIISAVAGCRSAGIIRAVYDTTISIPETWKVVPDVEHRLFAACKANENVNVNLICHSNTSTVDMTGEEYVSQQIGDKDMVQYHVEGFSTGREKVEVEKAEILQGKTSPMIHVRLSFEAEGKRYVHDRYVFVHNHRQYSLSGAWPIDAENAHIQEAEKMINSLAMK